MSDLHFFMCHKDQLNVYVTQESYDNLIPYADGFGNAIYSTLVADTEWKPVTPEPGEDPDAIVSLHQDQTIGVIYNMQGVRVGLNQLHKGELYIKDGKKYMKK